jgi:hypothetical protein
MGDRGSQGGRVKSSLHEGAPSPVRGGGCRLAVARLGHLKGKRGRQGGFAALRWSGRRIGSGREFRPDGKHLASRARLFDPEPRAPAGSGTKPSDPLHGASRAQPLMKILGLAGLGDRRRQPARTGQTPRASTQSPGMRNQRLVPQRPEPHPASTTDASGASLARQDTQDMAQVRRIVKNK